MHEEIFKRVSFIIPPRQGFPLTLSWATFIIQPLFIPTDGGPQCSIAIPAHRQFFALKVSHFAWFSSRRYAPGHGCRCATRATIIVMMYYVSCSINRTGEWCRKYFPRLLKSAPRVRRRCWSVKANFFAHPLARSPARPVMGGPRFLLHFDAHK